MSVDECIENYPALAKKVFGKKQSIAKRLRGAKFNEENLKAAIQEIVNLRIPSSPKSDDSDHTRYPSEEDLCKT